MSEQRRLRALLREAVPWLDHEPDEGRDLAQRIERALEGSDMDNMRMSASAAAVDAL